MNPEEEIRRAHADGVLTRDFMRTMLLQADDKKLGERLVAEGIKPNMKAPGPRRTEFIPEDDE